MSFSGTAALAASVTVDPPCDITNKGDGGLRACTLYLNGGDPSITTNVLNGTGANPFVLRNASTAAQDPGILKILRNKVITQLGALYGLYSDPPPSSPPPAGWAPTVTQHTAGVFFNSDNPPGSAIGPLSTYQCNIVGFTGSDPMPFPAETPTPGFAYPGTSANSSLLPGAPGATPGGGCGTAIQYNALAGVTVGYRKPLPSGSSAKSSGPPCSCVDNGGTHGTSSPNCPAGDTPGAPPGDLTPNDYSTWVCLKSDGTVDKDSNNVTFTPCSSSSSYSCNSGNTSGSLFYTCIDGVNPVISTNMTPPFGTAESSYLQGSYSSALACFYNQVVQQISNPPYALKIDDVPFDGTTGPSQCLAQATALTHLRSDTDSQLATLKSQLTAAGVTGSGFQDIINCKQSSDVDGSTLGNPQIASLRQQAQHLCAMRADMEEAFYRLAECQVLYLSQIAWENVIVAHLVDGVYGVPNPPAGTPPTPGQLVGKVMEPCGRYCKYSLGNQIFHNPGKVTTNGAGDLGGALTAGWDWLACSTCEILSDVPGWLGGPWCHPGDDGSPCDQSPNCPIFSPYGNQNGNSSSAISNFEQDAKNHAHGNFATGTLTQRDADIDLNTCMNACYNNGVSGGYIYDSTGAKVTSLATDSSGNPIAFYVAGGTTDPSSGIPIYDVPKVGGGTYGTDSIPSFKTAIHDYLIHQWPDKYDPSKGPSQCALGGPNP